MRPFPHLDMIRLGRELVVCPGKMMLASQYAAH